CARRQRKRPCSPTRSVGQLAIDIHQETFRYVMQEGSQDLLRTIAIGQSAMQRERDLLVFKAAGREFGHLVTISVLELVAAVERYHSGRATAATEYRVVSMQFSGGDPGFQRHRAGGIGCSLPVQRQLIAKVDTLNDIPGTCRPTRRVGNRCQYHALMRERTP